MAEKTSGKKRRVKNPETFREKALKASQGEDKPRRAGRVKQAAKPVAGPVARFFGRIFGFKPLRILGKILVPAYFRNSWRELRQVTWPTWRQSLRLTFAVLVFAVIFGATIAAVDYGLDKVFRSVILNS